VADADISLHVRRAFVSAEDMEFFHHDGFSTSELGVALREALSGERFRGASTITQQLAKNIWLSPSRNPIRKVREVLLTRALEKHLTKRRILELYMNVVELGPGIYGVGHAAQVYFGKPARLLSSLESAYLATLLPRPLERYEEWCRDRISKGRMSYIHAVHRRMLAKGSVTQEEFDEAEAEGLVFSRRGFTSEAQCLKLSRGVAAGEHKQEAISGLLVKRITFGE
jgi:monofunctional biosynthetic peptidoglycan transglycosylase